MFGISIIWNSISGFFTGNSRQVNYSKEPKLIDGLTTKEPTSVTSFTTDEVSVSSQSTTSQSSSSWRGFLGWITNVGRSIAQIITAPFRAIFKNIEELRLEEALEEARTRGGVDANNNEALTAYHQTLEGEYFQYHPPSDPNSNLPAVVVVYGNRQEFDQDCGPTRLVRELIRQGHPVLALRPGFASSTALYRYCLSSDHSEHLEHRYAVNSTLIEDFTNHRGLFSNLDDREFIYCGYSLGGGTGIRYTHENPNNNFIAAVNIAPVHHQSCLTALGVAEIRRPNISGPVMTCYNGDPGILQGSPPEHRPGDYTRYFPHTHCEIDEAAVHSAVNFIQRIASEQPQQQIPTQPISPSEPTVIPSYTPNKAPQPTLALAQA